VLVDFLTDLGFLLFIFAEGERTLFATSERELETLFDLEPLFLFDFETRLDRFISLALNTKLNVKLEI